jgi:arylsulfate sulfotransferase
MGELSDRYMKILLAVIIVAFSQAAGLMQSSATAATVAITGQNAGPTPFISQLHLTINQASALTSIRFEITPKQGSVTRAISATYYSDYLLSRGYLDPANGQITLPVFGLYQNYTNTVTLTYNFVDGSSQRDIVAVSTAQFSDPCGYHNPLVVQARTNSTDLSYDFILLKNTCSTYSPTIIDTDAEIRWVGTASVASLASIFFDNGVYISSNPSGSSSPTGLTRIELDGTFSFLQDYSGLGVTSTGHHNIDYGKRGIILDVDTAVQTESVNLEVDGSGNVLKTWDLATIIAAAMTAGGDDPSQFVYPAPTDWFHNNAAAYRSSDDSLIVSSRENFVICLDYETGAIKWILGDSTKKWYQFPSLRKYALSLGPSTLPPIGQHAVSLTQDDDLLLFDDGKSSFFQIPAGADRTYSAPRKYHIDTQNMVATEIWNYEAGQTLDSGVCSSVYEDSALNYLIDYALITEIIGLNASGNKVFDYHYPNVVGCSTAWNSMPVHLEALVFGTPGPVPIPKIGVSVSSTQTNEGASATFTISASTINPFQATTVHYSMSGKAKFGIDYTLSGVFGQAIIPAGASSITVVLQALSDTVKEKNKKATMKLSAGTTYKLSKVKKATVTIVNVP